VVISTPFVLQVFESDINHQITFLHQASARSYYALEASSPLKRRIAADQNSVARLEEIITSGGSTGVDPSSDPEYRELLSRLKSDESQQNTAYSQWQCLLKGVSAGSCQAGGEQAATASHQEYLAEVAAVEQDSKAVQSRQQQILEAASQARNSNLKQAVAALPSTKAELAVDQAQQRQEDASFNAANNADNGLFARLSALDQAAAGNSTLNTARWLLILLISIIEILPILVKVLLNLGPENTYEKILDIEETMIVRAAREDALRRQSARSLE
jgi:hypothetical protein